MFYFDSLKIKTSLFSCDLKDKLPSKLIQAATLKDFLVDAVIGGPSRSREGLLILCFPSAALSRRIRNIIADYA